jgi:hypothetical protein
MIFLDVVGEEVLTRSQLKGERQRMRKWNKIGMGNLQLSS